MVGELIAQCVRQCVKEAIYKQEGFAANRPLRERLAERGLPPEKLLSLLDEKQFPVESSKLQCLRDQVERSLTDEKIASLVLASLRYDDDLKKGLIPPSKESTVERAVFEQVVLVAIRNYLSDKHGTGEAKATKLGVRDGGELGPFTTCVLEAILKDAYSKLAS